MELVHRLDGRSLNELFEHNVVNLQKKHNQEHLVMWNLVQLVCGKAWLTMDWKILDAFLTKLDSYCPIL